MDSAKGLVIDLDSNKQPILFLTEIELVLLIEVTERKPMDIILFI